MLAFVFIVAALVGLWPSRVDVARRIPGIDLPHTHVSWLVIFERLAQADFESTFFGRNLRPGCAAYWERLKKREGYAEAIQGHSHPTIVNGTERLQEAKRRDAALRIALEGA